jgi:hypothetical protein
VRGESAPNSQGGGAYIVVYVCASIGLLGPGGAYIKKDVRAMHEILCRAQSRVTSFPRKRESASWTDVDPRLRGGDEYHDFHHCARPAKPMDTQDGLNRI